MHETKKRSGYERIGRRAVGTFAMAAVIAAGLCMAAPVPAIAAEDHVEPLGSGYENVIVPKHRAIISFMDADYGLKTYRGQAANLETDLSKYYGSNVMTSTKSDLGVSGNDLALEMGPAGRIPHAAAVAARAPSAMFAAHSELPSGTQLLVTDATSGRAVLVTVAARQPAGAETVIDLSPAAVEALGGRPPAQVRVVVVWRPTGEPTFFPVIPFDRDRSPVEKAPVEHAGAW